jgi:diketogulonate reductase-like aldo/keto reductase
LVIWCSIDRLAYRPTLFWLDCYLLHWRGRYPLDGTIAAFEQLKSTSKILSWDVSNFDVPDLEDVRKVAGEGNLVYNRSSTNWKSARSKTPWPRSARSTVSPSSGLMANLNAA